MIDFQNIDELKKHCTLIHAFGLGFIQIKLGPTERIHCYTSQVHKTSDLEEVHTHRYSFSSRILQGSLTQTLFRVAPEEDGSHVMTDATCKPGLEGSSTFQVRVEIEQFAKMTLTAGSSYDLDHETFHRVEADEGTITYLTRPEHAALQSALVVRLRDAPEICPFSSNTGVDAETLWSIYESLVK